ncbi:MAG: DUF1800 domain-containing protein [Planctomycetota bacterium]|jgi:uncharacterized protein (DUF1800 family)
MPISRRTLLAGGASAAAGSALAPHLLAESKGLRSAWAAGCERPLPAPPAETHLLNRATFGASAKERAWVRIIGPSAWIEEQLQPERLDDAATETALAPLTSLSWTLPQIKNNGFHGTIQVSNELVAATLYRAVASRRQLFEVMVDFWSNQLNVYHPEEFVSRVKTWDDREVFRKHALGDFRDLVHGSATSPAMLRYLNANRNTKAGPNENYARELMELHTLGVDGGYDEADVKEVARAFTGWRYRNTDWAFEFNAGDHSPGPYHVIGQTIDVSGVMAGHAVIDRLIDHPSCARHVARRLCQRFVSDEPSDRIITDVAAAFGRDGDIRAMLRILLNHAEFQSAYHSPTGGPAKIRRPMEHWAGALRALEIDRGPLLQELPEDAYDGEGIVRYGDSRAEDHLQRMDHLPFRWPAPDGYPDTGAWWSGMHVLAGRWNFAMDLAEGDLWQMPLDLPALTQHAGIATTAPALVDYWSDRMLGRPLLPTDRDRLITFLGRGSSAAIPNPDLAVRLPLLIALLLDSPYFTWR